MGDKTSKESSQNFLNEDADMQKYFQKELDIAIANEKIEKKYERLRKEYSSVKFEGKK